MNVIGFVYDVVLSLSGVLVALVCSRCIDICGLKSRLLAVLWLHLLEARIADDETGILVDDGWRVVIAREVGLLVPSLSDLYCWLTNNFVSCFHLIRAWVE